MEKFDLVEALYGLCILAALFFDAVRGRR